MPNLARAGQDRFHAAAQTEITKFCHLDPFSNPTGKSTFTPFSIEDHQQRDEQFLKDLQIHHGDFVKDGRHGGGSAGQRDGRWGGRRRAVRLRPGHHHPYLFTHIYGQLLSHKSVS